MEKADRQVRVTRSVACAPESEMTIEETDLPFCCSGVVSHLGREERMGPQLKVHSS